MRNLKFLAGLATILIFIAFFCFKAAWPQKRLYTTKDEDVFTEHYSKLKLKPFLLGLASLAAGIFLLIKTIQLL